VAFPETWPIQNKILDPYERWKVLFSYWNATVSGEDRSMTSHICKRASDKKVMMLRCCEMETECHYEVQGDSKLLSGFPSPIIFKPEITK
jgi:hypothetical protein